MKKSILLILLVAFLTVAVGISGCLDSGNNSTNNTTNGTNETPVFDENIVQVNPLPAGFEILAVSNVTTNAEIDGITDEVAGYSASFMHNNSTNVYLSAFQCTDSNAAAGYVQQMVNAHNLEHPNSNNVTTVTVNGHNATLLTTVTGGSGGGERYELAWNNGDILVVVNGPASYNLILAIAEASGL